MRPDELKEICKKYRQKKSTVAADGFPINDELDETGDEIADDDLVSTNGSTEQLNKIVSIITQSAHNVRTTLYGRCYGVINLR